MGHGFNYQQSLAFTSFSFALIFLISAISVGPGVWLMSKMGIRFAVLWGSIALIFFYGLLALSKYDPILLILASICGGIQVALYWTAYHIYFAELTDDKKQGEEISINTVIAAIASVGSPAFGGLIINYFGYQMVFIIISILMMVAIFPLKYLPKTKDTISIDIIKTIMALSPRKELKSYLALAGDGITVVTSQIFWPIYVLTILSGVVEVGLMGSLIALAAAVTTITIGLLTDKFGPKKILNITSSFDALTGVLRVFVMTPIQVLLSSIASAVTSESTYLTVDSMVYQRGRHKDIVAFVIQREIGLSIGRIIFLTVIGTLLWFGLPIVVTFIITALLSLTPRLYPSILEKSIPE